MPELTASLGSVHTMVVHPPSTSHRQSTEAELLAAGRRVVVLDDWLDHFGLGGAERHHAVADAFASAQLLQIALAAAQRHEMGNAAALVAMQKAQRWL